jgi:tetratricopeptide (TPR) repeat protein
LENPPGETPPGSAAGERLDSWKEIASYLKRGVRSVQRWEVEEGMPVHRHHHDKRGTVYAFSSELDAWWMERGALITERNGAEEILPPEPEAETPERDVGLAPDPLPRKSRRAVWTGAGLALAAIVVAVAVWLSRSGSGKTPGSRAALPFQARDWVLLAGFENRTGEPLFDGTLDYALARELSNSRHVTVVPRERIADALRLMRKPPDTKLDSELAREVCLRDGEIHALLTGRIEKIGPKYVFSVELRDPKPGTTLAGFSEESARAEGSLAAIRRISDRIRAALGEAPASGDRERPSLAKVTTSNLRALQLYSQADRLMGSVNDSQGGAEELLRQAVAEDPSFASAYIHLAHAINNQNRPKEDYLPFAETAFRLSEATSERERYFIRGSYYYFLGQREKAIAAWEALVSLHPDHGWAVGNLVNLYELPQDLQKAVQIEARLADSHPRSFGFNWHAAYNFVVWKRDPARARPYLRRAAELVTPEVTEDSRWPVSWMELLPFTEHWMSGDVRAASGELDRFAGRLDSLSAGARTIFALKTALAYLTIGRIDSAEQAAGRIPDPVVRNDTLAQISFIRGDAPGLREKLGFPGKRELGTISGGWWETLAILQARAGLMAEARRYVKAEEEKDKVGGWLGRLNAVRTPQDRPERHAVPGEIALARGNLAAAVSDLERALDLFGEWEPNNPSFYLGSESLAAALVKRGDAPGAIKVLERASERRVQAVINNNSGLYWLRIRLDLARLYRKAGREEDARAVEEDLSKLLAMADADHPIVRELREPRKS